MPTADRPADGGDEPEYLPPGGDLTRMSATSLAKLRVRAEIDERDYGAIKVGQRVVVRSAAFRGRDVAGTVSSIAPIIDAGRIGARGQRNLTDVNVAEVVVDLAETGPLAVGMKVDVYFAREGAK
jgi:HlyD family secretion protein